MAIRPTANVFVSEDALGLSSLTIGGGIATTIGDRWTFSLHPRYWHSLWPRQYVATVGGGNERTCGCRYVFAKIYQSSISSQLRIGYAISPGLSLDLYAEPFMASGRYYDHGELPEPGAAAIRTYRGGIVETCDGRRRGASQ